MGSRYTLYLLVVGQLFAVLEAPVTGFSDGVFLHLGILLHFAYRGLVDIGMNCRDCCDELDRTRLLPEAMRKAQEPSQKQQGSQAKAVLHAVSMTPPTLMTDAPPPRGLGVRRDADSAVNCC